MTIAELARFFNEACGIGADLTVVPMENWRREMYYEDTGLPWVMPSPNMPTVDTAVVYPGTVLFEGTNVSEGRGTTRPFELIGAPWVDAEALADKLASYKLPGVHFRPVVFEPTFQKHAKQACGGCQIHVLDRDAIRVVETAVAVLVEIRAQNPAQFAVAAAAVRVRAHQAAVRHSRGVERAASSRSKRACRCERFTTAGCPSTSASAPRASRFCCTDGRPERTCPRASRM